MIAKARIKKIGRRWHWSIVVRESHGHGYVYQGDEATWKLSLAMMEFTWVQHRLEWELPHGVRRGLVSTVMMDRLAPLGAMR